MSFWSPKPGDSIQPKLEPTSSTYSQISTANAVVSLAQNNDGLTVFHGPNAKKFRPGSEIAQQPGLGAVPVPQEFSEPVRLAPKPFIAKPVMPDRPDAPSTAPMTPALHGATLYSQGYKSKPKTTAVLALKFGTKRERRQLARGCAEARKEQLLKEIQSNPPCLPAENATFTQLTTQKFAVQCVSGKQRFKTNPTPKIIDRLDPRSLTRTVMGKVGVDFWQMYKKKWMANKLFVAQDKFLGFIANAIETKNIDWILFEEHRNEISSLWNEAAREASLVSAILEDEFKDPKSPTGVQSAEVILVHSHEVPQALLDVLNSVTDDQSFSDVVQKGIQQSSSDGAPLWVPKPVFDREDFKQRKKDTQKLKREAAKERKKERKQIAQLEMAMYSGY